MIDKIISKAIKEQSWLSIEYNNSENRITKYWIAIKDLDVENKSFFVNAFNVSKINNDTDGLIDITISFDKIKSAYKVENTTYVQPESLIKKIMNNLDKLDWLSYDSYNDNTLDYIHECMKQEEVAYQKETTLIRGLDQESLENVQANKKYVLSIEQLADLIPKLERLSKQEESKKYESVKLALNLLSIETNKGLFVVAYKELDFNPIEKALIVSKDTMFNYDFASPEFKDFRHNLRNYLDIETDEFVQLFILDPEKAKNRLALETKKHQENLDDRPYIFELRRSFYAHIEKEITHIKIAKKNNMLSVPLEAFFGNMSKDKLKNKRHVDVVILDDKANIDQLRVAYNALIQPITYVQGPPGTGKTSTILNVLISAFFNHQKVLVSSNNNKPINDIFDKLLSIKNNDRPIPLPFLRIGNNEEVAKTLNYLKDLLPKYQMLNNDDIKLNNHASNKKEKMKAINSLLGQYEEYVELEEEIDALEVLKTKVKGGFRQSIIVDSLLDEKRRLINSIHKVDEEEIKPLLTRVDKAFLSWLFFTSIKYLKKIQKDDYSDLNKIIYSNAEDDVKVKEFNSFIMDNKNFKLLQEVFPIILTTNHSAYKLGEQELNFDLVILDEAGQCAIGPSLFPISRGERLLLVGDQNQLKPVISIAPEVNRVLVRKFGVSPAYDYLSNSILSSMQKMDTISKFVILTYHYRSRKKIIAFSNAKYYHGQLKLALEDTLKTPALEYINVDTSNMTKQYEKNISPLEIEELIRHIKESKDESIGVITPFRNQAAMIKDAFSQAGLGHIDVGTVHTFQGDEKDTIYISSGITKKTFNKTFDWVKDNEELINVATTRARKKLVVAADFNEVKKRSSITNDFYELTQYVKNNGKEVVLTESSKTKYVNGLNFKNYNTKKEDEFFETINHIMSMNSKFKIEQKVRVASILDRFTDPIKHDYGLRAEFDMVVFQKINNLLIPKLVIELDGDEHTFDKEVIKRDKLKEIICKENGIDIVHIQNDYSRRYVYLKEFIINILQQ